MRYLRYLTIFFLVLTGCTPDTSYRALIDDPEMYHQAMNQLTLTIVDDIFSPPVASRIYVYPSIAGYEVIRHIDERKYQSFAGQLSGLKELPKPDPAVVLPLASIYAFVEVGKSLIYSKERLDNYMARLERELTQKGLAKSVFQISKQYGALAAQHILAWADDDGFKETRNSPSYSVEYRDSLWLPTPPDFMEGIEPNWYKIRPMVMKNSQQFQPAPPLKFSLDKSSEFYKELSEVYHTVKNLNEEQTEIANFWDCNPYATTNLGHAVQTTKKITPGGHWIGITTIASRTSKSSFVETVEAHSLTSIALFDAFISCWDEKWRSKLIRPETLINQHLDEAWKPLLQTPPFPEYTSGHSVISTAAAIMLTKYYGENFVFTDTTELAYGLPARSFESFQDASEEAGISRLYGGIHYRMAIEEGIRQGNKVGKFVSTNLRNNESRNGVFLE